MLLGSIYANWALRSRRKTDGREQTGNPGNPGRLGYRPGISFIPGEGDTVMILAAPADLRDDLVTGTAITRFRADGEPIDFNGIAPDELVWPVPEDLQQGRNTCIRRAEEWLKEKADLD